MKYGATIQFHDDSEIPERMRGKIGVVHYQKQGEPTVAVTLKGEGPDRIVHMSPALFDLKNTTSLVRSMVADEYDLPEDVIDGLIDDMGPLPTDVFEVQVIITVIVTPL
jgi:hypothetical protein